MPILFGEAVRTTENFGGEQFTQLAPETALDSGSELLERRRPATKSEYLTDVSATPQTLQQASHFIPIRVRFSFLFYFSCDNNETNIDLSLAAGLNMKWLT